MADASTIALELRMLARSLESLAKEVEPSPEQMSVELAEHVTARIGDIESILAAVKAVALRQKQARFQEGR